MMVYVIPCVEIEDGADLLWGGGEHVQVVEGTLVPEAAQLTIADHLLVSLLPSRLKFSQHNSIREINRLPLLVLKS